MVSRTGPLIVGTSSEVPSTASCSVTGSSTMMSSPSRWNSGCGATVTSTSASPGAPSPMPGMPWPFSRMICPSRTPAWDAHIQRASVRQRDPARGAVHRVEEVERQMVLGVLAAHREPPSPAGCATGAAASAERLGENALQVLGVEARGRVVFLASRRVAEVAIERALRRHFVAGAVDLAAVVAGALVLVAQQVVGDADLLESLPHLRLSGVDVGVVALGELAVGGADGGVAVGLLHAEDFVWVWHQTFNQ